MIVQQERASNTPFEVSTQLNPTYKVPTDKKQAQARYVSPALPIHSLQLFILAFQIVFQPLLCQSRYCSCGIFGQVLQTAVGGEKQLSGRKSDLGILTLGKSVSSTSQYK